MNLAPVSFLALVTACGAPPKPPATIGHTGAPATDATDPTKACDSSKVAGTVHDLDAHGAPLVGVTIIVSTANEEPTDDDTANYRQSTKADGSFSIHPRHPFEKITAYYADLTFEAKLPKCSGNLWLGIRNGSAKGGETYPLVIR